MLLFMRADMPMFFPNKRPVQTGPKERRTAMIAALVRFIQEWKRYNRSLNELSRLGDRELADIGISRSDIPRVAWNAAHRS
jgi:uncharacterized protein YjiS (DUF1127 family)